MSEPALPHGWIVVRLGQVARIQLGKMLDKARTGGVRLPYLRNVNVRWGRIDTSDLFQMPFRDAELERFGICDGDVLVCEGGEPGRAAVWRSGPTELKYQKALHRVRLAAGISPDWLVNSLYFDSMRGFLARQFTGTTIAHLTGEAIQEYELRVAPSGEQMRVLDSLASYFTRLDDAVATLSRVERNLKRYRASVLKSAVEGRLVPTEAALAKQEHRDYEPASVLLERILTERRRRWSESGKKGKYEEPAAPDTRNLPELPEGWCWATVDALIAGGPQNGVYVPKSQYGRGRPILRIDDYQTDWSRSSTELQRIDISEEDANTYGLRINDIVVNRVNSPSHLGKSIAVAQRNLPAVFESNMMRMSLASAMQALYVQQYLSSTDGKRRLIENAKWAVNQASINQTDVARTPIPLPPAVEQMRIVDEVVRLVSSAQDTTAAAARSGARCQRLRQSILKWAFEGKLADQDPSDEPASALLERIKAERATPKAAVPSRSPRVAAKKKARG